MTPTESCQDCVYFTTKKSLLGINKAWCSVRKICPRASIEKCRQYTSKVDVGAGKAIYYEACKMTGILTETEADIMDHIEQALEGNIDAMLWLGSFYNRPENPFHDEKASLYYYNMAADQNSPEGLFRVGLCYDSGTVLEEDAYYAETMIQKAADQNHLGACYWIGATLRKKALKKDKPTFLADQARKYLHVVAQTGHAECQLWVGELYLFQIERYGYLDQGLYWLCRAYLHGDHAPDVSKKAREWLNWLEENDFATRDKIEKTIDQINAKH